MLVDDREGSKQLHPLLLRMGLPAELTRLEFGDIAFEGCGEKGKPLQIGIEYKELGEAVSSMQSGRLAGHQAPGMLQTYDYRYLLIHGVFLHDKQGRMLRRTGRREFRPLQPEMSISEFNKRVHNLYTQFGLVTTVLERDVVQWIVDTYHYWTDQNLDEHKSHLVVYDPPTLIPISDERALLMKLPGVGVKTSALVQARFGTILATVKASKEDWQSIEGIGPVTAARVYNFIRGGKP